MRARLLFFACSAFGFASGSLCGCVEQSPDVPTEEDVRVAKENILSAPPATIRFPVNASLEGKVVYLGLDVDAQTVTPGKPFTLTHYWKVIEPIGADWRMFVHLGAPGTKASHLNADHVPVGGKYPVHAWKKGDIIRDIHRVSVPAGWKAPAVEIFVGMWKSMLRMKVVSGAQDGENRIVAARIPTDVQPAQPKRLIATRIKDGAIKLDGKLDDAAWKSATSTGAFVKSLDGSKADSAAEARVLWDDKNLYVGFTMEDADVWTTLDKRDDKLWTQEAVEMFIDADGDGKTYVELQANPKGALFDSWLPRYRENQNDFDSGVKVAVNVDGTVDKRDDKDKGWTVEMQIPIAAARGKDKEMKGVPPMVGTAWKVNFFRMDMPAGKPQQGTAWSPPMVGDFHALDKFAELVFGDEKGAIATVASPSPPAAPAGAPASPAARTTETGVTRASVAPNKSAPPQPAH